MDSRLRAHLWKSPDVRGALKKEARNLLFFIVVYIGSAGAFRYFTDRPIKEGLLSAAVGSFAVVLARCIAVGRTIRTVLREHAPID